MKREPIPMPEVLAWLHEHHPELHADAEVDRNWIWICSPSLKEQPEVRESIKAYGFRFCFKGHPLPCGKIGTWSHSCEHPIGFKRRGKQPKHSEANELSALEAAMLV